MLLQEPFCKPWSEVKRLTWFQVENLYIKPAIERNKNLKTPEVNDELPTWASFRASMKRNRPDWDDDKISEVYSDFVNGWDD